MIVRGSYGLSLGLLFFRGLIKCRSRTKTIQFQQSLCCQSQAVFGLQARLVDLMVFVWHQGSAAHTVPRVGFCCWVWPSAVWMSWRAELIHLAKFAWCSRFSIDHGCNWRARECEHMNNLNYSHIQMFISHVPKTNSVASITANGFFAYNNKMVPCPLLHGIVVVYVQKHIVPCMGIMVLYHGIISIKPWKYQRICLNTYSITILPYKIICYYHSICLKSLGIVKCLKK